MNDSTSKPGASPVEAALDASFPDCSRVASDVTPIRSARSRFCFSLSLGRKGSAKDVRQRHQNPLPYNERNTATIAPIELMVSISLEVVRQRVIWKSL